MKPTPGFLNRWAGLKKSDRDAVSKEIVREKRSKKSTKKKKPF